MKEIRLKKILFNLFDMYDNYEDIIYELRTFNSLSEISNEEYDIILKNFDKWLTEYERGKSNGE